MPEYQFLGKAKVARGFNYPLKRRALDTWLDGFSIPSVTAVAYCEPSDDNRVLCADYRGVFTGNLSHSLTLWLNAVPSAFCQNISTAVNEDVLPKLAQWIGRLHDPSTVYSQTDHRFEIYFRTADQQDVCHLETRTDVPRKQLRLPRFRAKVRP